MTNPYDPDAPQDPVQPPYGQADQPTQAPYGQSPYGYGQQGEAPPGKGMAIAALVLSILACGLTNLISTVLAILVLVRSKDGRDHGKGFAIAALIINVLVLIAVIALISLGVVLSGESVDSLKQGQCVTANGLTGEGEPVTKIEIVDCGTDHDGEVVATKSFSAAEAADYENIDDAGAYTMCVELIDGPAAELVTTGQVGVLGLTQTETPDAGDKFVCVITSSDGSKLTEKLG